MAQDELEEAACDAPMPSHLGSSSRNDDQRGADRADTAKSGAKYGYSKSDIFKSREEVPKLHLTASAPSLLMLASEDRPISPNPASLSSSGQTSSSHSSSDRAFGRSATMPSKHSNGNSEKPDKQLKRAASEVGGARKAIHENVRKPAVEKLSDKKKQKMLQRIATVKTDGTVEFDLADSARILPELVGDYYDKPPADDEGEEKTVPPLQIVMLIVGTRGDVQPFVAIGKHLQGYGHRVRLATHANFRDFVMTAGLEFYPLGGDPKILAEYMVKNKGFLPSNPSEIPIQRKQLKAIINSLLPACTEPDVASIPFKAQAIIANPPAYGHVHVAECLKVPLHIFFTMPWTPTSEFPHPLARIKNPTGYRMSYQVVDSLIWWGIRGMINDFRKKKLKLRPITYLSGSQGSIVDLPTGYLWSPHLVPKPKDWGPRIDIVGFCFLDLAKEYKPPEELVNWLRAGEKPIYVGFGSLPVQDPKGMTEIIVEAMAQTGQRGIISKGWGGLGDLKSPPDFIYLLDNCPHDWLFPQCAAVVHHGGAGTTAAGLKAACPTTIVPIFGDQPFWGERVHARGVGPAPIPVGQFTLDKLVAAINYMLDPKVKEQALILAEQMEGEDGVSAAVNAFHKHLPRDIPQPRSQLPSHHWSFFQRLRRYFCC